MKTECNPPIPWFGLASEEAKFYRTILSFYDRTLSVEESRSLPLRFVDFPLEERDRIQSAYRTIFANQIVGTKRITEDGLEFGEVRDQEIEKEIDDFMRERLSMFINKVEKIIFVTNFDCEMIVYSSTPWIIEPPKPLNLRANNERCEWEGYIS